MVVPSARSAQSVENVRTDVRQCCPQAWRRAYKQYFKGEIGAEDMQRATGKLEVLRDGSRHARGFVSASWAANNGKALPGDDEDPAAAPGLAHPEASCVVMLRLCIHRGPSNPGDEAHLAVRGGLLRRLGRLPEMDSEQVESPYSPWILVSAYTAAAGAGTTARRLRLGRRSGAPHPGSAADTAAAHARRARRDAAAGTHQVRRRLCRCTTSGLRVHCEIRSSYTGAAFRVSFRVKSACLPLHDEARPCMFGGAKCPSRFATSVLHMCRMLSLLNSV